MMRAAILRLISKTTATDRYAILFGLLIAVLTAVFGTSNNGQDPQTIGKKKIGTIEDDTSRYSKIISLKPGLDGKMIATEYNPNDPNVKIPKGKPLYRFWVEDDVAGGLPWYVPGRTITHFVEPADPALDSRWVGLVPIKDERRQFTEPK